MSDEVDSVTLNADELQQLTLLIQDMPYRYAAPLIQLMQVATRRQQAAVPPPPPADPPRKTGNGRARLAS